MSEDGYGEIGGGDDEAQGDGDNQPPTAAAVGAPTRLQRMVNHYEAKHNEYWLNGLMSLSCAVKGKYRVISSTCS